RSDELATVIYTSGTTGPPKGVMITHANVVWQCRRIEELIGLVEGWTWINYLPMAHIATRLIGHYLHLLGGMTVYTLADPADLFVALPEVRPNAIFGPPRVWERLQASLVGAVEGRIGRDEAQAVTRALVAAGRAEAGRPPRTATDSELLERH